MNEKQTTLKQIPQKVKLCYERDHHNVVFSKDVGWNVFEDIEVCIYCKDCGANATAVINWKYYEVGEQ